MPHTKTDYEGGTLHLTFTENKNSTNYVLMNKQDDGGVSRAHQHDGPDGSHAVYYRSTKTDEGISQINMVNNPNGFNSVIHENTDAGNNVQHFNNTSSWDLIL